MLLVLCIFNEDYEINKDKKYTIEINPIKLWLIEKYETKKQVKLC